MHLVNIREPYFSQIVSGKKTIEGRINNGKFKEFEDGDVIEFLSPEGEKAECVLIEKREYKSFREMLKSEGYKNCIPNAKTLKEAVQIYLELPGFEERSKKYGVLALEIFYKN